MKLALAQMNSSDDPNQNLGVVLDAMERSASADLFLTPEVTNCLSQSRTHQNHVLEHETGNNFLRTVQVKAKELQLWTMLGSLAIKTDDADGRFANRCYLISPDGSIAAWYDKIHMFDVTLGNGESYRESKGYRPGDRAVTVDVAGTRAGLTICYDVRFPYLFRTLAQGGAKIITVPSAFAVPTGAAHWESLLRARAIETGCFILAPAQTGTHDGSNRKTYGHSLVVDPWGRVVLDAGQETGVFMTTIDLSEVDKARSRVPSLTHDKDYRLI